MSFDDEERSKQFASSFSIDRRSLLRASVLAGGALAARALSGESVSAAGTASPIASTKAGKVRGSVSGGINVFRGIPYGATPTGPLRFMPPVPPSPWIGVRDALQFGDQCPQIASGAAEAQKVADAMSSAWLAFAHTGVPDAQGFPHWPPYDTQTRATMIFNVKTQVVNDQNSELRKILEGASTFSL